MQKTCTNYALPEKPNFNEHRGVQAPSLSRDINFSNKELPPPSQCSCWVACLKTSGVLMALTGAALTVPLPIFTVNRMEELDKPEWKIAFAATVEVVSGISYMILGYLFYFKEAQNLR